MKTKDAAFKPSSLQPYKLYDSGPFTHNTHKQ